MNRWFIVHDLLAYKQHPDMIGNVVRKSGVPEPKCMHACVRWSLSAKNPREAIERYHACQIHREADRKTDRCGSKSLI